MEIQLCNQVGHARPEEGSEHYFAYCVENTMGHGLPHGDLVGPGIMLMSKLQGQDTGRYESALKACHIPLDRIPASVTEKTLKEEEVLGIARILSHKIGPDPAKLRAAFGVKLSPTQSTLLLMIFEHCLPFNVQRLWDELDGVDWPHIWHGTRPRGLGTTAGLKSNLPVRPTMRHTRMMGIATGLALLAEAGSSQAFSQDSLVWQKCSGCHVPAADGRIPRVEDLRTTPEEWTVIVDRMSRLHRMPLGKGDMDRLLKELCATQILDPQEQARVSYLSLWHNSQQMEVPADRDEERLFATCVRCHSAGKILSYRMTAGNWAKLRDFHLYVVPTVILQMREMHWIPRPTRHPSLSRPPRSCPA